LTATIGAQIKAAMEEFSFTPIISLRKTGSSSHMTTIGIGISVCKENAWPLGAKTNKKLIH
jgi:hypothetical protein